ncbi:MAG: RHS repeat-associated core domain-containing protein, partial [Myxococcota bacterium]
DGRGVEVAYVYDGLNRKTEIFDVRDRDGTLISMGYDRSEGCDASLCQNGAGYMVLKRYPGGADFLGRDVRRRPFSLVRVIEGRTDTLGSRHDNADRLIERIYPDGRNLTYEYDDASRLTAIPGVLDSIEYEERGVVSQLAYRHGVTESRRYDARLQLHGYDVLGASGELLQALTVRRDRASNVTSVEDGAAETLKGPRSHVLDAWYRSVELTRDGAAESFAFDTIDNILRRRDITYAYDRAGSATAIGAEARRHDGAGHLLEGEGMSHDWDFLGRHALSEGSAGTVRSVYGADHLRVARHVGGEITHYVATDFEVRDGVSVIYPMVGRARVARLESTDFVGLWLTGGTVDISPLTAGEVFLRAPSADQEAWLTASARAVLSRGWPSLVGLHHDELGSVVLATGAFGEVTAGADGPVLGRRSFGHFGAEAVSTGFVDRRGFTGQEHEPTGLIRYAHRVLSPADGRWLSPDPAFQDLTEASLDRLPEAVARYSYVLNNPGTHVDPEGLKRKSAAAKAKAFGRTVKTKAKALKRQVGNRLAGLRRTIGNRLQRTFRPEAARRAAFQRREAAALEAFRQEIRAMPRPDSWRNRNYSLDSLESFSPLLSFGDRPRSGESLVTYRTSFFSAGGESTGSRPVSVDSTRAPELAVQYRRSFVSNAFARMRSSSGGTDSTGPNL